MTPSHRFPNHIIIPFLAAVFAVFILPSLPGCTKTPGDHARIAKTSGNVQKRAKAVAKAMRLCVEAGIDIKTKAIWGDCAKILAGLKAGELKNWLEKFSGLAAPAHKEGVTALGISRDGKLLASGDDSGGIKLWSLILRGAHLKNGTGHAANSGVERASRPLTAKPPDRVARASCPWTARSAAPYAGPDAGETPALLPKRGQDARATSGTRARCPRLGVLLVPFLRCALLRVSAVPDLASGRGLLCASLPAHGLIQSQALQNPAAAQHQSPI